MATLDIPQRFSRARHKRHDTAVDGAAFLIRHVCDTLGLADLSDQEVLDVGCGGRRAGNSRRPRIGVPAGRLTPPPAWASRVGRVSPPDARSVLRTRPAL